MKLKVYNTNNLPKQERGAPYIHANSKTGLMRITTQAAERMGLKSGDKLAFAQDEDEPTDWYAFKSPEGFEVREGSEKKPGYGLLFNNTSIVRLIFESVAYEGTSGRMMIGAEPVKSGKVDHWPVITAGLKNS